MPRISPARTVQRDARSRSTPSSSITFRFSTSSTVLPGLRRLLVDAQQHLAADHQLGQLLGRGFGGLDRRGHLAAPHDADGVGDLHDLAQLVGDQDDRLALRPCSPSRMRNRWSASAGVSTPVGSSRIRMSALAVERLQDLDPLLHARRRSPRSARRDRRPARIPAPAASVRSRALASEGRSSAPSSAPRMTFSSTVKFCDQLEVLEHHADAGGDRGLAVGDLGLLPVDEDLARCRPCRSRRGSTSASTCRRRSRR